MRTRSGKRNEPPLAAFRAATCEREAASGKYGSSSMSIATLPMIPQLPPCDHVPEPYDGPTKAEVLALRRQYLTPGLITYYRDPLLVVEGHMQYLWDERS